MKFDFFNIGSISATSGLSNLSVIFKVIIIGIIYIIIIYALRLMYKDMRNGDKVRVRTKGKTREREKKQVGLEVMDCGTNGIIRKGSVVPIDVELTIGRKEDNIVVLPENYISGYHAKIFLKNGKYILQDLNSTNGTKLNGQKILGKAYISVGDKIEIGTIAFKVIG